MASTLSSSVSFYPEEVPFFVSNHIDLVRLNLHVQWYEIIIVVLHAFVTNLHAQDAALCRIRCRILLRSLILSNFSVKEIQLIPLSLNAPMTLRHGCNFQFPSIDTTRNKGN